MTFSKQERWAQFLSWIVGAAAFVTLVGWQFDIELLKRPIPSSLAMNPTTALLLLLVAIAFIVRITVIETTVTRQAFIWLIAIALCIPIARLLDILFAWPIEVDHILFAGKLSDPATMNGVARLSILSCFNFLFITSSLLYINDPKFSRALIAQLLAVMIMMISLYSIVGHLVYVPEFKNGTPVFVMSPQTAISFFILSVSLSLVNLKQLNFYNEYLARVNQESATVNEELQAAMEELTSTNEELEASNENLALLNTQLATTQEQLKRQAAEIIQYKDQQLGEYRKNLDIIFSNTQEGILLLDASSFVVLFNRTFERFFQSVGGYKPKVGVSLMEVVVPERREIAKGLFDRTLAGETIQVEAFFISQEGAKIVHQLRYEPVHQFGKVTHVIIISQDITDQNKYENRITAIAKEFAGLIENSNVPIFGIDRNGYISEWNQVMAEITQFNKNEVLTKKWVSEFVEDSFKDAVGELIDHVLRGNALNNIEFPLRTKTRDKVTLLLSASPRYDADNQIKGALIVGQNITELTDYRKGLEIMVEERTRELNEALLKEKELVDLKSKFVSMASHEFRTPLSTISLATGFLRRYKDRITPDQLDEKLDDIVRQVEHMNYLLEDVLTVGKTEAGSVLINLTTIEVKDFFTNIADEVYQSIGRTHDIEVVFSIDREQIESDSRMLRIITVNLLTNAIKFSPGREAVSMHVMLLDKTLKLEVADQGIGIPLQDQGKLFQSFSRGSNTIAIPGTGLGLSIVRKTVDLLKGSIQLASKEHEGTTFTVSIPIHEV